MNPEIGSYNETIGENTEKTSDGYTKCNINQPNSCHTSATVVDQLTLPSKTTKAHFHTYSISLSFLLETSAAEYLNNERMKPKHLYTIWKYYFLHIGEISALRRDMTKDEWRSTNEKGRKPMSAIHFKRDERLKEIELESDWAISFHIKLWFLHPWELEWKHTMHSHSTGRTEMYNRPCSQLWRSSGSFSLVGCVPWSSGPQCWYLLEWRVTWATNELTALKNDN